MSRSNSKQINKLIKITRNNFSMIINFINRYKFIRYYIFSNSFFVIIYLILSIYHIIYINCMKLQSFDTDILNLSNPQSFYTISHNFVFIPSYIGITSIGRSGLAISHTFTLSKSRPTTCRLLFRNTKLE